MRGGSRTPAAGPDGCLTIPGPSQPLPPPATQWATFFTTSGYRTLHEFRSQWNYFRILVNRKLGVFHKLSITAVRWAECGPEASNGWERPCPLPGSASPPPLAAPRPLLSDGRWFTSPLPPIWQGSGSGWASGEAAMARPWHARALKSAWAQEARIAVLN